MTFKELRSKYGPFVYENYSYSLTDEGLQISFLYKIIPDIEFLHKVLIINVSKDTLRRVRSSVLRNFLFNLGLIEIPNYWKCTCAKEILIKAGRLNKAQLTWWHDLFIKGMGQYFYENSIDFVSPDFLNIHSENGELRFPKANILERKFLVALGGGKDSIVSLNLLEKIYPNLGLFLLNPTPAVGRILNVGNLKKKVIVRRVLDEKLFELNRKGYLNGHTPFSSVLSFWSVFCAVLFGYNEVIFSNESSSNEDNTTYLKHKINHQYSKTFEFEQKFREYNNKYLSNVNYFSFLRPLNELQIAKIFSTMLQYHTLFRSCNVGYYSDSWCIKCSKCLSTFILLYPFLNKEKIIKIFGSNLYKKEELIPILVNLVDYSKVKPFECVGTREELLVGLYMSVQKDETDYLAVLLRYAKERYLDTINDKKVEKLLNNWDEKNVVKDRFERILKGAL